MIRIGRREEILNISAKLFSQKGYHGTTIRDISDACGILSGSLYAHISSKEDLLYEVAERGAQAFLESIRPIVTSTDTATNKLRRSLQAHIQVIEQNAESATVFFHEWKALTSERRAHIQAQRDEYEAMWATILREGMERGEFKQLDEKFARLLILSVGNWLYQWYQPGGALSAKEIADRFIDMMLTGFQP